MRRLMRAVRRIDDVAEVLIFDVALATRRRRRVAAAMAALVALALYVFSGVLLTPSARLTVGELDSRPLLDDAEWFALPDVVAATCRERTVPTGREKELEAELTKHVARMAHVEHMLSTPAPWRFRATPHRSHMINVGALFIARGILTNARSPGHESAMRDWVTVGRMGLAVVTRSPHRPTVAAGRISTTLEECAMRVIRHRMVKGYMGYAQELVLDRYLRERARVPRPFELYIQGERAFRERCAREAIEKRLVFDERTPFHLRMLQPAGVQERRDFVARLTERLARHDHTHPKDVREPSRLAFVRALFDRERAVDFAAQALADRGTLQNHILRLSLENLGTEVKWIEGHSLPLDLEGI